MRVPTKAGGLSNPAWLRRLGWASLAVNILIVVSGGVVRLTGSGLGCPTWPRCTEESFTPHGEMDVHAAIEFGNRLVTFLIAAVAIATFVVAWRHGRRSLILLALVLALGVPAQAVIGGISVLTDLNPWVVALHLLVSMAMIGVAVVFLRRMDEGDEAPVWNVASPLRTLVWLTFGVGWIALYVGTMVTGSGPHAGDADAPRNGLDPESLSQLHTDFVMVLLGLTIGCVLALRAAGAPVPAQHAAIVLLGVELAQGLIGFTQYFSGLPIGLVTLHLFGAAVTSAALTWLLVAIRERPGKLSE
ncbi:MAG: heme A synthase [Nocardioidaceae bacterium]|nr:MAG: heme A synthase [Nocardioidaceae bacterium]